MSVPKKIQEYILNNRRRDIGNCPTAVAIEKDLGISLNKFLKYLRAYDSNPENAFCKI